MQKMFKGNTICPFTKNVIDSPQCRQCKDYFKAGTWAFIWCKHPDAKEQVQVKSERANRVVTPSKVLSRKKATEKVTAKKGKGQKKRGRPKKAK